MATTTTITPPHRFSHPRLRPFPKPRLLLHPLRCSTEHSTSISTSNTTATSQEVEEGIPNDDVKLLAKFQSLHNHIRVLQVSRRADHPLAGSRLLLLDLPGNIHSISHLFNPLTSSYLDVFATLPPIIPPGPIAVLGFGAGSAARLILHLYPETTIHGYELDPSVISVAREFFGLLKLEKQYRDRLSIIVIDAIEAIPTMEDGFYSGILVDLFLKGSVIPHLQDKNIWRDLKKKLNKNGRIMVNCGGGCIESEDPKRGGNIIKERTLSAMSEAFGNEKLFVLNLGGEKADDSWVGLTGNLPDLDRWKGHLPNALGRYVDMWKCYGNVGSRYVRNGYVRK